MHIRASTATYARGAQAPIRGQPAGAGLPLAGHSWADAPADASARDASTWVEQDTPLISSALRLTESALTGQSCRPLSWVTLMDEKWPTSKMGILLPEGTG